MVRFRNGHLFKQAHFICAVGFICLFSTVFGQSNPKQAKVNYRLVLEHLPIYDSLQLDLVAENNQYDSLLMEKELKIELAYNYYLRSCEKTCGSTTKNRAVEDSLRYMQQEFQQLEKMADSVLHVKKSFHDKLLLNAFHQFSLEFCKVKSLDLLVDTAPLFSKQPIADLTDDFILFLEVKKKKL